MIKNGCLVLAVLVLDEFNDVWCIIAIVWYGGAQCACS